MISFRSFLPRLAQAATALALAGVSAGAMAQTKWDLPSAYPATNYHTENLVQFANDVDKATGGKLKITVHSNASLFKAPEIKRAVQGGQAQMGEVLLVNFQNEWQLYGIDGLPFLADSYADSMKLYKASKPALEKKLGEQGIMLLYTVPWPPQGIYVKKPIASAADLKGVKWRAYSPATARIAELVGAQPVTVQAAELGQAMATGVVESYMSSGSTGYDTKTYESIKYWYDTQAWLPKNAVLVNKAAFDALDKPTQAAVLKAGAEAETRGWALSQQKNGEYIELLKKNGMTILPPPPQLTTDMKKVGDIMLKEWLEKAGPEGQAVVDAYRKM
ncbi:MAG: TRAP transporter substrate-binding protein [Caldimonas sp.]